MKGFKGKITSQGGTHTDSCWWRCWWRFQDFVPNHASVFSCVFHYIKPRYEPRIRGKCKDLGALRVWGPEGKALPNCHNPIEATWWSLCHRPQYCHKWVVDALWTPRIWIDSTDAVWRRESTTLFTASNTELRKSQLFDLRWKFMKLRTSFFPNRMYMINLYQLFISVTSVFIPEKREQPLCVIKFGSPYIVGWCHGGAEQTSEVCDDKGVEQGSEACWICPGIGVPSNVAGRSPLSREVLIRKSWHKWWIHQCHVWIPEGMFVFSYKL